MPLLRAADVACPEPSRRVEFAQSFDSAQDAVLDADGDVRHG